MSISLSSSGKTRTAWLEELRGSTKYLYGNALKKFDRWLEGRDDEIYSMDRLVAYMSESHSNEISGSFIIDEYLRDPIHKDRGEPIMYTTTAAIISYLKFMHLYPRVNYPKNKYRKSDIERDITLVELRRMCDESSTMERAILLVLFHRGLDTSTFAEEFNRKALGQMVEELGKDFRKWDLSRCPIPIKLRRVKTGYKHIGFLDRDAVEAIQKYLQLKENMKNEKKFKYARDDCMFISSHGKPMNKSMVYRMFVRIARNAGVRVRIEQNVYSSTPHQLRGLCKTTLKESGTHNDVAQLAIGHTIDRYDKYSVKFLRAEYKKASFHMNIITNNPSTHDYELDSNHNIIVEKRENIVQEPNVYSHNFENTQDRNHNKELEFVCTKCRSAHE